jgi:hypothetical protein
MKKVEIANDDSLFRLTDGEEDGITGEIVSYGERSILDETQPSSEQWWFEIDENGEFGPLAYKGDGTVSEPVCFEMDCEFEEEDEDETEDAEETVE